MRLLRWWLAGVFFVSGLTLLWAPLIYPDEAGFWVLRLDPAILIGVGLLCATYGLTAGTMRKRPADHPRIPPEPPPNTFRRRLLISLADGFLVFSVLSFVFNMVYMLFHSLALHPAIDTFHLLPVLYVANPVWEKIICRSADPIILWLSTVVLMDGVIGMFVAFVLSPIRLIPRSRIVFGLACIVAFCGVWAGMLRWGGRAEHPDRTGVWPPPEIALAPIVSSL